MRKFITMIGMMFCLSMTIASCTPWECNPVRSLYLKTHTEPDTTFELSLDIHEHWRSQIFLVKETCGNGLCERLLINFKDTDGDYKINEAHVHDEIISRSLKNEDAFFYADMLLNSSKQELKGDMRDFAIIMQIFNDFRPKN